MLLRPVSHDHQLMGMLQLINRTEPGAFSLEDVSTINYVAERLGEFLYEVRQRSAH
jgi:hypothetical protein